MELSLNFIVVLTISLIVFGFGVKFITDLFLKATDLSQMTSIQLDDQIRELVCGGSERVCIDMDRKTIPKKEFYVFTLKITNILEPPAGKDKLHYIITVSSPLGELGYDKNKQPIISSISFGGLTINPKVRDVYIAQNEDAFVGIGVQVPSNAISGTYVLNVKIETESGNQYSLQKLYVDVP